MNHAELCLFAQAVTPQRFVDWLRENPEIWEAFEREAFIVINMGITHYSARTIIHFLRHHSAIVERGSDFKINDHHSPYLARLFAALHPEHSGLWEYRTVRKYQEEQQHAA